jgi:hypothetical protein
LLLQSAQSGLQPAQPGEQRGVLVDRLQYFLGELDSDFDFLLADLLIRLRFDVRGIVS